MTEWEIEKALYLCKVASTTLKMNLQGYGECSINPNSGYTYLWLEDYPFCLYMNIHCILSESDVWVLYTDMYNGTEYEEQLDCFANIDEIYKWVESIDAHEENA
jgi:hypothetical protein